MSKKKNLRGKKRSKQKKSSQRKVSGVPFWRQPVFLGLLIALSAFIGMLLFSRIPSPEEVAPTPQIVKEISLTDLRVEVESLLWRLGLKPEDVNQQPSEGVLDLRVKGDFPDEQQVVGFDERLQALSTQLRVESYPPRRELRVFSGPALTVRLRFLAPSLQPADPGPAVTIIMDDIGRSLDKVRRVLALEQPVTLAILPSTPYAQRSAELAHDEGREVMVHIPMEPQGYPAIEPGRDALLLEHSAWEIERRLKDMFQRIPYAVGGNNHMGSRYTEYDAGMRSVGEFLRERGFLFVDSRTTGKTLAEQTMQELGVPSVSRDVFLDNNQDVELIRREIRRLATLSKRYGLAVGICHPHPETIEALQLELPQLAHEGVRFVSITEAVRVAQSRGN